MEISVALIQDSGVRFPQDRAIDPLIDAVKERLMGLSFEAFDQLSIYMHLPGPLNTFGLPPGVTLRLDKRARDLTARTVLDGESYRQLRSEPAKLNACLDGIVVTLRAVGLKYKPTASDIEEAISQLEAIRRPGSTPDVGVVH